MADEPCTELSQASFAGDLTTVIHLLNSGADHLEADTSGRTALHWAVLKQHLELVEELLAHHRRSIPFPPPKPSQVQIHTFTFVQLKRLASRVRPVVTPIELAAQIDAKAIFKLLLENLEPFAETTVLFNGIWASAAPPDLHVLVHNTRVPSKEAYTNKSDWFRDLMAFILQLAIKDDKLAVVDIALRLGVDVNAGHGPSKFRPLHVAAWCRQEPACIRLLLNYGANPDVRRDGHGSPLSVAIGKSNTEAVSALLEAGASPNVASYSNSYKSLLCEACHLQRYQRGVKDLDPTFRLRILRALLKAGADPQAVPYSTLLSITNTDFGAPLFKELVAWGADLNTPPNLPCLAMTLARRTSLGTEHDYRAILDRILTAHGSLSNLREVIFIPNPYKIRYLVILDLGLHVDCLETPSFDVAVGECMEHRLLGHMELLMDAAYKAWNVLTRDYVLWFFSTQDFKAQGQATAEVVESALGFLRILDHSETIDPDTATEVLFSVTQSDRVLGADFQRVVDTLLDMGAGLYHPQRSLAHGQRPKHFHDILALSAIYGRHHILSPLLKRLRSQAEGKESSLLTYPTWFKEDEFHSARLDCGNDVDAILTCLKLSNYLLKADLAQYEYPLAVAIERQDVEAVRKLVSWGLDVNWQDEWNWTLLHIAVDEGCPDIVDILLEADTSASINVQARRILQRPDVPDIRSLLRCTKLISAHPSPLHLAAFKGNPSIVRSLLEHGADAHAPMSKTPSPSSRPKVSNAARPLDFALFVKAGCELGSENKNKSIPAALHPDRLAIAAMLVERGARMSKPIAAEWKELKLDEILDKFSGHQLLWDMFATGTLQEQKR